MLERRLRKEKKKRKSKKLKQTTITPLVQEFRWHAHTHIPNTPTPYTTPTYYEKKLEKVFG